MSSDKKISNNNNMDKHEAIAIKLATGLNQALVVLQNRPADLSSLSALINSFLTEVRNFINLIHPCIRKCFNYHC